MDFLFLRRYIEKSLFLCSCVKCFLQQKEKALKSDQILKISTRSPNRPGFNCFDFGSVGNIGLGRNNISCEFMFTGFGCWTTPDTRGGRGAAVICRPRWAPRPGCPCRSCCWTGWRARAGLGTSSRARACCSLCGTGGRSKCTGRVSHLRRKLLSETERSRCY